METSRPEALGNMETSRPEALGNIETSAPDAFGNAALATSFTDAGVASRLRAVALSRARARAFRIVSFCLFCMARIPF